MVEAHALGQRRGNEVGEVGQQVLASLAAQVVSHHIARLSFCYGRGVNHCFSMFFTEHNLFEYQANTIINLANNESCVIIGRAADFILKGFDNVVSVDIQAPKDVCVIEIMHRYKISWQDALNSVETTNNNRAEFYRYYTGRLWNDPCNYDLTLNSARVGRDRCADVIIDYAERKLGRSIRPEQV